MNERKRYDAAKIELTGFILRELIDDFSEVEIAKMLTEISLSYLKYPVIAKRKERGDESYD